MPRTKANESAFSATPRPKRRRGRRRRADLKKATTPRVWLTTLWHVGTGLPWGWRTGPSDSSERRHLTELLAWLPERAAMEAQCQGVGIDEVLDYRQRLGRDRMVNSPTYEAVAQPVHKGAIGRWQNYAEVLEPAIATLEPFRHEFGYE